MEERLRTWFTDEGLALATEGEPRHVEVFCGALHYWRIPPDNWPAALRSLRQLGLNMVETYVPWSVHEDSQDSFSYSGNRDLRRFITLAAEADLLVALRPGPHINAELTLFGFPERILRNTEIQAVTARDTPAWLPAPPKMFPVPSYAAAAFRSEVARWYQSVGEQISDMLWPSGPVVAIQVDNEQSMFFRLGAFDLDYHPDAIKWWNEFAPEFSVFDPPRHWDPGQADMCAKWVRFKAEYAARSLAWLNDELDASGAQGIARFHNLPSIEPRFLSLPRIERAISGIAGTDYYETGRDYQRVRRRALHNVGSTTALPMATELGVGGPPWLPPMRAVPQQQATLAALSAGLRAFNLYMAVDRERWYGAALSDDGSPLPIAQWYQRLIAALRQVKWWTLRRHCPVALILSCADARFAIASSMLDPLTPIVGERLELGPGDSAEASREHNANAHQIWWNTVEHALQLAQVSYDIVDEECEQPQLERYRAVIAPTVDRIDRSLWRRLHAAGQAGVRIVIGPVRPQHDERGRALAPEHLPKHCGLIRPESMGDIAGLADDLIGVAGELSSDWITEQPQQVECSVFTAKDGTPQVLFVANQLEEPQIAHVTVASGTLLTDALDGGGIAANEHGVARIALEAHDVRMMLIGDGTD